MTDPAEPLRNTTLSCKACPARWDADVLTGVSLTQWVQHLELVRCPDCGAAYEVTSQRTLAA